MLVLAHAGHWLVSLVYAAPALLLGGAVGFSVLRERRRARRASAGRPPAPRA